MTDQRTPRQIVVDAIATVAPDTEPDTLGGTEDYLDELDLDSMDQLNIAVCIFEQTGVEIPERDYPRLRTLDALADYLHTATTSSSG